MVGGILAGAIIERLNGRRGLHGWQWLFIIEGALTMGIAILCYFILPDYPSNTRWLSEEEKTIVIRRLQLDNLDAEGSQHIGHWESFKTAFKDWRTYLYVLMYTLATGAMTIT